MVDRRFIHAASEKDDDTGMTSALRTTEPRLCLDPPTPLWTRMAAWRIHRMYI
jgi:hypothetical protein